MRIVKFSHPKGWDGDYKSQFPNSDCVWDNYKFEINTTIKECDFWIIHESVDVEEKVKCIKENVIFLTSEEKQQKESYSINYLAQFSKIITTRNDIVHPHVLRYQYLSPWHVKKRYSELNLITQIEKKSNLSTITSDAASTSGHKKRYAFVNRLKGHFKDKLVWFGKGEQFIDDKWEGLQDFRYSIAMENSSTPYYWTEKIADCYLALTMPIYYGCPNIIDYFPEKSFIQIDIDNYKAAIEGIEQAIEENYYQKNFDHLLRARDLLLNTYQFVPALVNILKYNEPTDTQKKNSILIKPETKFTKSTLQSRVFNKIKNTIM